ncbi:MAG: histidine kinase [Pseudomonadales bacterium]|nr:histidine kinase [Pseudomonadales bacterium]
MEAPFSSSITPLLPNLGRLPVLLAILLITELLVILYVFSLSPLGTFDWQHLSLLSLYAQWISLLAMSGLSYCRSYINRQPPKVAGWISFGWIVAVTVLSNIGAQWVYAAGKWAVFSFAWLLRDMMIIAVLAALLLRYLSMQQRWRAEQKASQGARIEALHARIRPHFLFNSMNTIASLISYAPVEAEKAVEDLAALFRAALSQNDVLVSWQQEMDICRAYLRIEQQRLGRRLLVDWQLDRETEYCQLPPLSVQPLIENAIYHGIESTLTGGTLLIRAQVNQGMLRIDVENPLEYSDKTAGETLNSPASPPVPKSHNGIALDNIRARLAAIYPQTEAVNESSTAAELRLSESLHTFIATLILPINLPARASTVDGDDNEQASPVNL